MKRALPFLLRICEYHSLTVILRHILYDSAIWQNVKLTTSYYVGTYVK